MLVVERSSLKSNGFICFKKSSVRPFVTFTYDVVLISHVILLAVFFSARIGYVVKHIGSQATCLRKDKTWFFPILHVTLRGA